MVKARGQITITDVKDGQAVGRNLFVGIKGYTSSNPYTLSSKEKDGFKSTGICTVQLDGKGGKYVLQVQTNREIAARHGFYSDNIGKVTVWLYLCKDYTSKKSSYDLPICFNSSVYSFSKTQEGAYCWIYDMPEGYFRAELRFNTYSDGTTVQTADFWNMKIEKGDTPTAFCLNEADLKGDKGDKGQSISSADVVFATSSSQTSQPQFSASSPTTASSLITNANKELYLWQATKTTYLDGTKQTTDYSGYTCLGQIKSFATAIEQYAIGTYQQATGTWYDNDTSKISKTQGMCLWTRTKLTYNSGDPSYSPSEGGKCVGYWGTDGNSVTIKSTETAYHISNNGTTPPSDSNWTVYKSGVSIPQTTDSNPYLWTRVTVTYNQGNPVVSYSVSYKGKDGHTPSVTISSDGFWVIDGTKTNTKAQGNDGHTPTITISSDGYWVVDGNKTTTKAKGEQGNAATSYYITPEAIVITERVNGITFGDDDTYTAKDYTYDIDHTIAIHKAVGNVDTIVKADSISVIEGGKLGLDKDKLQASYKDGTGYQLSSAITNSGLEGDTSINKIVVQFSVGTTKLLCPIYINRLGTVTTQTVGDATKTVRRKVVNDVKPSIDAAQKAASNASDAAQKAQDTADTASTAANNAQSAANKAQGTADSAQKAADKAQNTANAAVTQTSFEAYQQATAQQFTQVYTKSETQDVALGKLSQVTLNLSDSKYDQDTFYLAFFKNVKNIDREKITMRVERALIEPRTKYGTDDLGIKDGKGAFTVRLQWREFASGYGTVGDIKREILSYEVAWNTGLVVGSIGQHLQSSVFYVYLRGGTTYDLSCDHEADIVLASQSDLDALEVQKDVPSLTLPLSKIVEPIEDKAQIRSEIKQKASEISATITEGLTSTGIDIKSHKITSKADNFEWDDNSGNPMARFDNDNGATFSGNVSAKTLSTNSGKSRIDEDGILHAEGADLNGTLTTNEGTTRAVLSGGGLQMFDNEVLQTEHTGKTFATAESILPSKDGATISIPTNAQEVTTETVGAGESKTTTLTLATFTATANGVFKLDISDLHAQILGDVEDSSQHYGPRLYIELLLNDTRVWFDDIVLKTYSYSYVLREDPFSIKKYINAGQKYTLTLSVTIDTISQSSTQTPKVHGTCSVTLQSAKIASDSYLSMFFGNGLMFAKDYNHYIISMLENNIMKFEARNGNNGVSFDGDGIKMLASNGSWYKQPITVAYLRVSLESSPSILYSSISGFAITRVDKGQFHLDFPGTLKELGLGGKGYLLITSNTNNTTFARGESYNSLTDTGVDILNLQGDGAIDGFNKDIEIKIRP